MSKILFFDTETTGKADFRSPAGAAHQPCIVQLAALLCDDRGRELASLNLIVNPKIPIPAEVSAIHGITDAIAEECGVSLLHAMQLFATFTRKSSLHVAHNIEFDWFVVDGEALRIVTDICQRQRFCTMKAMMPVCKIPGRYDDYKWPRLQEAYRHAFGKEFDGAHDALADVRACKEIYFWLKDRPAAVPPAVIQPVTVGRLVGEMRKAAQ